MALSNCLVAIVHTKPVNSNSSPKIGSIATSLSTYGPPSNTWFLWPIRAYNPNSILIGSTVFAQMSVECPYTLLGTPIPPSKLLPLYMGGSGPPSNTRFLWSTRVLNPNGISSLDQCSHFTGLTSVTDRATDDATQSVTMGRIVRSTAMRPNNSHFMAIM